MSQAGPRAGGDERRQLLELLLAKQKAQGTAPPAPVAGQEVMLPLSESQRRIWSRGELAPDLPWGNVGLAFELHGPLRADRLEAALDAVRRRHEILRTAFRVVEGEPLQQVMAHADVPLRAEGPDLAEGDPATWARAEAGRPLPLDGSSLLRARLRRLGPDRHVLVLATHHLAVDGVGVRLLLREIGAAYAAAVGESGPLPPLEAQYADFALWQREWLRTPAADAQLAFWRKTLDGAAGRPSLPIASAGPAKPSFEGATHGFHLPVSLAQRLRALSRQEGVTTFVALLAALQVLFRRDSGEDDVSIGTAVSNRARHEFAPLIGNFSNHLLLRAQMSDDPSFRQLLRRSNESVLAAFGNQDLPFGRLADSLLADGLPLPRLESLFILRDGGAAQHLVLPSIRVESIDIDLGTAFLDLTVDITETADGLSGGIEYRRSAFSAAAIAELALRFEALLAGLLENPDRRGSAVPLPERTRIVGDSAPRAAGAAPAPVAPRDELEAQLAKSWQGLLGKPSIGIHDDFFALGGTSVLALALFTQIEKVHGKRLPLSTLFQASTVEQLAAVLRREDWTPPWSSLVAIQPKGSRPPLYCVHGHGGNVLTFQALSRSLGTDQPVYGLQAPGLDGGTPISRMEDLAARYVADILAFQPEGPYYLEGMSFGGMVALEMAQQLRGMGKEVGLVALVDTYPESYRRILRDMSGLRHAELRFSEIMAWPLSERIHFVRRRAAGFAKRIVRRLAPTEQAHADTELVTERALAAVRRANTVAAAQYEPRPYGGPVVMFWASKSFVGSSYRFRMAWHALVPVGLEMHIIPGTHSTMFEEPSLGYLADKMRQCLDRARVSSAAHDREAAP